MAEKPPQDSDKADELLDQKAVETASMRFYQKGHGGVKVPTADDKLDVAETIDLSFVDESLNDSPEEPPS